MADMKRTRKWICMVVLFFVVLGCAEDAPDYASVDFRCKEEKGTCTNLATILCGPGMQPITEDDPNRTDCPGHCCIPEENETTCSLEDNYMCIPGDKCSRPWRSVEGSLTCNEGRVCCAYRP